MGIGNAFNTALSGLTAFSTKIGYISENLANTSTLGYKRVDSSFQSYVTASNANYNSSGGVTISPSYTNTLAGQISSTSTATNFAISDGNGFIPVEVPTTTSNGTASFSNSTQLYTRSGDFSVNSDGYLVNNSGQYLMGLKETTAFSTPAGSTIPSTPSMGNLVGVRVDPATYNSMPGAASTTISINDNFPASLTASATIPDTTAQATSQVQFYDSLGTVQTLQLTYQKTATGTWNIVNASLPSDSAASVTLNGVTYTNGTADTDSGAQVVFDSNGALSSVVNGSTTLSAGHLGLDFSVTGLSDGAGSTAGQTISLDYGTTTTGSSQYSGSSLEVRSTSDTTGHAAGEFQSASVDKDGYVVFSYSNGLTAKPYRVPLVTFNNADGLDRVTGSTFSGNDTQAGAPVARWAGEGDAGTITPSSTEASNVDIADELTSMIVAQRAYSANGKVITTTDEMIKETLNLKQ